MTDRSDSKACGSKRDSAQLNADIYGAYLVARACGGLSRTPDGYKWSLGESYAAALGVHHFHRGVEPLSMRDLLSRADEACETGEEEEEEEPLGPSPPDPGVRDLAVRDEREACAAWLEKWPNAGVLAGQIREGVHVASHGSLPDFTLAQIAALRICLLAGGDPAYDEQTAAFYARWSYDFREVALGLEKAGLLDAAWDVTEAGRAVLAQAPQEEEPLGPSPPDPGIADEHAWNRLQDFISENFPEERGKAGLLADKALRLLRKLSEAQTTEICSPPPALAPAQIAALRICLLPGRDLTYKSQTDAFYTKWSVDFGDVVHRLQAFGLVDYFWNVTNAGKRVLAANPSVISTLDPILAEAAADAPLGPSPPDPGALPGPWVNLPEMTAARAVQRAGDDHLTTRANHPHRPQDLVVDDQDPMIARVRALSPEGSRWIARILAARPGAVPTT